MGELWNNLDLVFAAKDEEEQFRGGDFPPQVIGRSILTTSENENGEVHVDKTHHRKEGHRGFTLKPLIRKNHGKEEELYYNS